MTSEIQKFFLGLLLVSIFHLGVWGQNEEPKQNNGRILGRVFDADSGESLQGVTVVVESSKVETKTDIEGRYRISNIAPGNYSLLFFKQNYQRTRVSVEEVEPGRTKLVDLPLNPDYSDLETLDEFEITAEELAGTDIQLLSLRQESMVVMDAMGSFDMSRLGAGNVADALTKMVGTSVQDGKYVVVRGLADRYSNATFNGVPIPSSDVYRNTPQLDLFPSVAVDSISIKKSMSPELGAAFSGGSVDVVTKAYPEEFTLNVSVGTKYNEILMKNGKYLTYDDGSSDQWGFGLDSRKLPVGYEETAFWNPSKINPTAFQISEFMAGVDPLFIPKYVDSELGRSVAIEFGNLIEKKDYSLGLLFSFDFENSFSTNDLIQQKNIYSSNSDFWQIDPESSFKIENGSETAEIGSYFQSSFIPNEDNEIGLIVLWSHTGEKKASYSQNLWKEGLSKQPAEWENSIYFVERFELGWEERDMLLPQIYGKHYLDQFPDWKINWRLSKTLVSLDDPERRSIQRGWNLSEPPSAQYAGPPTERSGPTFLQKIPPKQIWRTMKDESTFHRFDLESPRFEMDDGFITFELGFSGNKMDREFDQTELILSPQLSNVSNWSSGIDKSFYSSNQQEPETFTGPGLIYPEVGVDVHNYFSHPTHSNVLTYEAKPNPGDYLGNSEVNSFYWGTLVELPSNYRLKFGARVEDYSVKVAPQADIEKVTIGPYVEEWLANAILENLALQNVEFQDKGIYPSMTLAKDWDLGVKTSLSYGESTARPNFRELAYVETFDPITDSTFKGNPNLKPSEIKNYDFRVDWNLSETDIISTSLFLKEIDNPIQATLGHQNLNFDLNGDGLSDLSWANGTDTFINSDSAEVYGIEIEFKKGLEQYNEILQGFRIGGNLTWSQSSVKLSQSELGLFPDSSFPEEYNNLNVGNRSERSLEGQSEWIYTIDLSYNNEDLGILSTIIYSFYDKRLNAASYNFPDDLWEDEFSTLDFVNTYKFGKMEDWKLKFSAKNLTAEDRIIRVNNSDIIRKKYETPRVYSLSLEKSF